MHREDDDIPHLKIRGLPLTAILIANFHRATSKMPRRSIFIHIGSTVSVAKSGQNWVNYVSRQAQRAFPSWQAHRQTEPQHVCSCFEPLPI